MTKTRDVEERMGQRTCLMESRIGSVECILKNLKFKMEEHHVDVMAMFQKLTLNSSSLSQEKSGEETLGSGESTRTVTRYATPAKGNPESSQNR